MIWMCTWQSDRHQHACVRDCLINIDTDVTVWLLSPLVCTWWFNCYVRDVMVVIDMGVYMTV